MSDPVPIGEVLQEYLSRTERDSVGPRQRVEDAFKAAWGAVRRPHEVGELVRVSAWRQGVAYLEVKSPPLVAELAQFRRSDLLTRMREATAGDPVIKDIRFRLGAW